MRLSLCLPQLGPHATRDAVRDFAQRAETLGFDALYVQEHLFFPTPARTGYAGFKDMPWPAPYEELLAPLDLLAFAAAVTTKVRLGTSILVAGYHRPVQLSKRFASLDVLSKGRMELGLGAGWAEEEFALMEVPFEERGGRADELIPALRACWGPDPVTFEGTHFNIPESMCSPKPIQDHIPVIGGFLSPAGLRRTAQHCDVWQPAGVTLDQALEGMKKVNELAEGFGRSPLKLSWRIFASPHVGSSAPGAGPVRPYFKDGLDELKQQIAAAKEAGLWDVLIDSNFYVENPGEDGWRAQPDWFAPLLDIAHG